MAEDQHFYGGLKSWANGFLTLPEISPSLGWMWNNICGMRRTDPFLKRQDSERCGSLGSRQKSFAVRRALPRSSSAVTRFTPCIGSVYMPLGPSESWYLLLDGGGTVNESGPCALVGMCARHVCVDSEILYLYILITALHAPVNSWQTDGLNGGVQVPAIVSASLLNFLHPVDSIQSSA